MVNKEQRREWASLLGYDCSALWDLSLTVLFFHSLGDEQLEDLRQSVEASPDVLDDSNERAQLTNGSSDCEPVTSISHYVNDLVRVMTAYDNLEGMPDLTDLQTTIVYELAARTLSRAQLVL